MTLPRTFHRMITLLETPAVPRAIYRREPKDIWTEVIDLRRLFDDPRYYANPIEPSMAGGARLAEVICSVVAEHDFGIRRSTLYPGPLNGAVGAI